jgi:two-component system phosphate regulon sensor histidine kinase PhoR
LRTTENLLDRPEVRQASETRHGEANRISETTKRKTFYIATAFGKGKPEGIVRLAVPFSEIDSPGERLKILAGVVIFLGLTAIILLIFASLAIFVKPVKITKVVPAPAPPPPAAPPPAENKAEIEELKKTLDRVSEEAQLKTQELITEEARLEALSVDMFDGAMVLDPEGHILLVNQLLRGFLAIKGDPAGKSPLEATKNAEIQRIATEALQSKNGVISRMISLAMPQKRKLSVHATPVLREGSSKGAVLVFQEVKELPKAPPKAPAKKPAEALPRTWPAKAPEKAKKTPAPRYKSYKETLLGQSGRRKRTETHSLYDIAGGAVLLLKRQAQNKSITIAMDIPKDMPKISVADTKISRIFFNLIDNAVKYTPSGGRIIISAHNKNKKFLRVDVSDTGRGISKKELSRIFKAKAKKKHGLSTITHIVHGYSGHITAQSIPGKGSTFSFTVPKA